MKSPAVSLVVLSSLVAASAQQVSLLTPVTLPAWKITTGDPVEFGKESVLTLPAGSQIGQSVGSADLQLQIATRPTVGKDEADWPVLEFGSAAVVFSRVGNVGKILLVVTNGSPVELPSTFTIGADGRSIETLAVSLTRSEGLLNVSVAGKSRGVVLDTNQAGSCEIVVSAGTQHDWIIDRIVFSLPSTSGAGSDASLNDASPGATTATIPKLGDGSGVITNSDLIGPPLPTGKKPPVLDQVSVETQATVELFTAPTVRRNRVQAIRATLNSSK